MTMLGCLDLSMTYSGGGAPVPVLRGVTLEIERGEFVAVMGPSGSGKSTLLHCLGLLETPTAGDVVVAGRHTAGLNDREKARLRREAMGFVFQSFYLAPGLTVRENVLLPLLIARSPVHRDGRAGQMLERVGLGHRLHHKPSQLSGGEQQRVAIARALVNRPPLLLLDEPTGNLDSATGESVLELLCDIHRNDGVTAVMVTHAEAAARRCERIITIRDGGLA